jgi:hypothetical protein
LNTRTYCLVELLLRDFCTIFCSANIQAKIPSQSLSGVIGDVMTSICTLHDVSSSPVYVN